MRLSWRGKELDARAEVIVRRTRIGATADDLGFTRGADGKFEALVSDILLSRFDRRWFQKLNEHYDALESAAPQSEPAPESALLAAVPAPEPRSSQAPVSPRQPAPPQQPPPLRPPPPRPEPVTKVALGAAAPRVAALDPLVLADSPTESASLDSSGIDLERELREVLSAARAAGGKTSCLPFALGWAVLAFISIGAGRPQWLFFGTILLFVWMTKKAKERATRMAEAGVRAFRARLGAAMVREAALRKLQSKVETSDAVLKPVVKEMLRRLQP